MSSKIEDTVHRAYSSKPKYAELQPGLPEEYKQIKTLGDLLKLNYRHASVDEQLRGNLLRKLRSKEHPYPGIIGYDDNVIPSINRAILSGHDVLLVGQIGQAKTKIAESIATSLLSPIPVVRGTITNDIPTSIPEQHLISLLTDTEVIRNQPEFTVSRECEERIRVDKLETKIDWLSGADRFKYVLSTPDISVKDLVGQIDAIKIAKKGVELYSIEAYSAGQLLQARHGILCIDELPVLDPRKQVALLSVLQEGKFTTGAYPVIFKPDAKIIATANPIDYTHSGKIIEPLFDRLKSHVDTHYPRTIEDEMLIILQEAKILDRSIFIPEYMIRAIAMITQSARSHSSVNHDKGVSVRMAVHSMEVLLGEAERTRSVLNGVTAVPRFSDLHSIHQSSKFELSEMEDTRENRSNILDAIIQAVLKELSLSYIQNSQSELISKIKSEFGKNKTFHASQTMLGFDKQRGSADYQTQLSKFPFLKQLVNDTTISIKERQKQFVDRAKSYSISTDAILLTQELDGEFMASVTELVLEGLCNLQPALLEKKEQDYVSSQ
jgi:magnesium chelatase subunit I